MRLTKINQFTIQEETEEVILSGSSRTQEEIGIIGGFLKDRLITKVPRNSKMAQGKKKNVDWIG